MVRTRHYRWRGEELAKPGAIGISSVSIRDLDVRFGAAHVLKSLDLEVDPGEFLVLLGPSGCGKSTLLNVIAGLLDASDGEVWIGGRNVTWDEPKDRGIGMVFQSYALYPRMTVAGNLSFGLKMAGTPKAEVARRIEEAARLLQITPLLARRPAELSGGQRQRVAIGRALVREAAVFLFDEPLSNLDAALRAELRVELKRLHQALTASTMIYVTHDQVEAMTLADRIAVMNGGVIEQLDTPRSVYKRPNSRFVAGFVGSPKMNFLTGTLAWRAGCPVFICDPGGSSDATGVFELSLEGYAFRQAPGRPAAMELAVEFGIRPEDIRLVDAPSGTSLPGRAAQLPHSMSVEFVEPMGAQTLVWCTIGGHTFSVLLDADSEVAPGDSLAVSMANSRVHLFDDSGTRL